MTCDEIRHLEELGEEFKEMRKMVISNPLFSDRYMIKTLNNIINYIIFAKEENALSYNEILKTVNAQYRRLFFAKAGFSEFHFWDDSFEVRKQKNQAAELLCYAAGAELGRLCSVNYNWSELTIVSPTSYEADAGMPMASACRCAPEISPEDINLHDTAVFVWEIM